MYPFLVTDEYEGEDQFQPAESRLLALALTCRQFQQPALTYLWESVRDMAKIIKTAGPDLWKMNQSFELTRPITSSDIVKMAKYASPVRDFSLNLNVPLGVWKAVQRALESSNQKILFPNVVEISFADGGLLQFFSMFETQGLRSFAIESNKLPNTWSLVDFSAQIPCLTSLRLMLHDPKDREAAVEAVSNWKNLSQVNLNIATPEMLQALSFSKNIRRIDFFQEPPERPLVLKEADSSMFQALQVVVLQCYEVSDATKFIESLPATANLQDMAMSLALTNKKPPAGSDRFPLQSIFQVKPAREEDWLNLLQSLTKYSNSLKRLSLVDRHSLHDANTTLSNQLVTILATHFLTLCHVEITYTGTCNIDDNDVKALTKALPQLKEFLLDTTTRYKAEGIHIRTTVISLVSFAQNCPLSTDLTFLFDASEFVTSDYSESSGQALKLKTLNVSISMAPTNIGTGNPQPRIQSLAKTLVRLFPNLKDLEYETYRKYNFTQWHLETMYVQAWDQVESMIKRMRAKKGGV